MDEKPQPKPIAHPFDVVVVADFIGPAARRFEILTLFFLASWLEFGGRSRALPLHIVSIGETPKTVQALASRCGAEITEHEPLLFGGFANKLRGFEVHRQTEHILLLDADMLLLSDIHSLPAALGGECIAAGAANGPCPVKKKRWLDVHRALGLGYPDQKITPLNVELDTYQSARHHRRRKHFPPYYNGGIVYAPWATGLGELWQSHMKQILKLAPNITGHENKISNQPSLATAIQALRLQGHRFQLLPDEYHVRWQHISTGAVTSQQAKLLHAIGFMGGDSLSNPNPAEHGVARYLSETLKMTKMLKSHRNPLTRLAHRRRMQPQLDDCHRVYEIMNLLYEKHVRELCR